MRKKGLCDGARRRFIGRAAAAATVAVGGLAAEGATAAAKTAAEIDRGVTDALADLFRTVPDSRRIARDAFGALVIPDVLKAGFIVAGSYGEGALVVDERIVSYWSYTAGSIGFQAGGQRTRVALFFMSEAALEAFRRSDGVDMGVDAEITVIDGGRSARLDSYRGRSDVVAFVFGRAGLLGGASYSGGKYQRLPR